MKWQKDLVPLKGSAPDGVDAESSTDFEARASVTVVLRPRSDTAVREHIEQQGRRLPHQHKKLTAAEIDDIGGAAPEDVAKLEEFARHWGLEIVGVGPYRRFVRLEGSLRSLASAFGVSFLHQRHEETFFRTHLEPVSVPRSLRKAIVGVTGLDDRPRVSPSICIGCTALDLHDPRKIAREYDFPEDYDGTGQKVAIVVLGGGFYPADVDHYFKHLKIKRRHPVEWVGCNSPESREKVREALRLAGLKNVPVNSLPTLAQARGAKSKAEEEGLTKAAGWTIEATTDVELAATLAPGAEITVHFVPNSIDGILTGLMGPLSKGATVISNSWGCLAQTYSAGERATIEQALKLIVLSQVSVCCASGDYGDGTELFYGGKGKTPDVLYPAASPSVLACGGTSLEPKSKSAERAWNEKIKSQAAKQTYHFASGGGVATFYKRGELGWQDSAGVEKKTGKKGRGLPDVAAKADVINGFVVYIAGEHVGIGGTSSATPLWAALICRLNQALGHNVGHLTPKLYDTKRFAAAFTDIVKGKAGKNRAAKGWDPCTGLGSPIGDKLLEALRGETD